jgi:hypothetical protein
MQAAVHSVLNDAPSAAVVGGAITAQTGPAAPDTNPPSAAHSDACPGDAGLDDDKGCDDERMDEVFDLIRDISTELQAAYAELFNIGAEKQGITYRVVADDIEINLDNVGFVDPAIERLFFPKKQAA